MLDVQLVVRKGDDPMTDADPVNFLLGDGSGNAEDGGADHCKLVHYGDDIDIYLNGLVAGFASEGESSMQRFQVLQRGVPLDNKLNMHNTVEFIYASSIQLNCTNTFDPSKEVSGDPFS